jgi:hypothetical protein
MTKSLNEKMACRLEIEIWNLFGIWIWGFVISKTYVF